jgi:hypothetical protein
MIKYQLYLRIWDHGDQWCHCGHVQVPGGSKEGFKGGVFLMMAVD